MKKLWTFFFAFFVTASNVCAQNTESFRPDVTVGATELPETISGRWMSPDRRWSQTWTVEKITPNSGRLTWWSTRWGCSQDNIPVRFIYDGSRVTITAIESLPCTNKWEAILVRKGSGYEGVINFDQSASIPTVNATAQ